MKRKFHIKAVNHTLLIVISQFFFGDVVLTLLPIGVIALLRYAFGQFDESFFELADWSFASIVLSGLAMVRILEVKIGLQGDTSERPILLSRICVLVLIASVLSLSLSQMSSYGLNVAILPRLVLQFSTIAFSLILLIEAHAVRAIQAHERDHYPSWLSKRRFQRYLRDDVKRIRYRLLSIRDVLDRSDIFLDTNDTSDLTSIVWDEEWCREIDADIRNIAETISKLPKLSQNNVKDADSNE